MDGSLVYRLSRQWHRRVATVSYTHLDVYKRQGLRKGTEGTETSKYPEEQKSTEIPLVVASERGLAQSSSINGS